MSAFAMLLAVALAGAPAPAKNQKTQLKIELKPAAAVVFVDGQRKGTGARAILLTVTPGNHKVKATYKGDTVEEMVVAKKGAVTTWTQAFEDSQHPKKSGAEESGAADTSSHAPESATPAAAPSPKSADAPKGAGAPKSGDEPSDP